MSGVRGGQASWLLRLRPRLPTETPPRPVAYTPAMVVYVGGLAGTAVVIAILTVGPPQHIGTLVLGGAVILSIAVTSVSVLSGVDSYWSASGFAHLGLALAIGPAGALTAAVSDAIGGVIRFRSGWFRALYNAASFFVSDVAAWAVYRLIHDDHGDFGSGVAGGLCAGATQFAVNISLLSAVQKISHPALDVTAFLRRTLPLLPYNLGYGCAAFGAVLLVDRAGAGGFLLMLIPVLLLQLFLLVLAARTEVAEAQRVSHSREREELLQRSLDASDAERRRIARDLHDGVVQELAAISIGLRNQARRNPDGGIEGAEAMLRAADATGEAMEELRDLLRAIAPTDLQEIGIAAALDDLAEPLRGNGVSVQISVEGTATQLLEAQLRALYRIAQETLRNVAKHAEASRVTIAVWRDAGLVHLDIVDDGRGSSAEERMRRRREGHVGLSVLQDLAREAGGEVAVESEPRRGTGVHARLPWH
jgi:signal transduction histidine kinase